MPRSEMCLRPIQPMKTNNERFHNALVGSACTKPRQDGMPSAAKAHSTDGV